MASLDDIPTLPPTTPTSDDLIAIIDGADRRSPKRVSLSQLGDLIGGEARTALYKLAICGDSITAQNSSYLGTYLYGYAVSARFQNRRKFDFVPRIFSAHPDITSGPDFDFGYGAYSADQFLNGDGTVYPMQDVASAYQLADGIFVCLGSNPSETTVASIFAIWDTFLAAGKQVFASEVLPRAASFGPTVAANIIAANAALAVGANARRIPFLRWHSSFADSSGYCSLVDMPDGVHPGNVGAYKAGALFADFMSDYVSLDSEVLPDPTSGAWLTGNPYMTGTINAAPTGWTVPATCSAMTAVIADDGRWKRFTNTQAGYSLATYRQTVGTGKWKVGDVVRGVCRVRGVSSGWDMRGAHLRLVKIGGTTESLYDCYAAPATPDTGTIGVMDGLFITSEYTIPSTATGMFSYLDVFGSGTFDVQCCGLVDARFFR